MTNIRQEQFAFNNMLSKNVVGESNSLGRSLNNISTTIIQYLLIYALPHNM